MSTTYTAYTVVGIRIAEEDLEIKKELIKTRGCSHDIPDPDTKFCSECGKPIWIEKQKSHELIEPGDELFGVFNIAWDTDYDHAFIGELRKVGPYDDDSNKKFNGFPSNFEDLKKELKKALDKHGLWNEDNFGVWTVLYCSY